MKYVNKQNALKYKENMLQSVNQAMHPCIRVTNTFINWSTHTDMGLLYLIIKHTIIIIIKMSGKKIEIHAFSYQI